MGIFKYSQQGALRLAVIMGITIAPALPVTAGTITLGSFVFDSGLFGTTLSESDGGTHAAASWLNVVIADPGNPAYLTGANFNTGIVNIGDTVPVSYTIGYGTPIVNGSGADFGVVTARFSSDPITLTINGTTQIFAAELAVSTGVSGDYFFHGNAHFTPGLFVTPIDLSDFGVAPSSGISAITVTSTAELDLIRIAGFAPRSVPEPASLAMFGIGLFGMSLLRRRR